MFDDIDSRLKLLSMKCRRPVEHLLSGEYHSVYKGRGIEFEDVRPYQRGDDVRTMDWKVTARTGEAHIKRYIEEREQFIYLLVDVSASLADDPSGEKRKTAAELCSLVTLAALRNHDRVGLILFSDRVEHVIPPGKGRRHGMRIMEALLSHEPEGKGTSFKEALNCFAHIAKRRSVMFVVSDFLTEGYEEDLNAMACRHDVSAFYLADREQVRRGSGLLRVHDRESGEEELVDLALSREESDDHCRRLREQLINGGVNLMEMRVGEDCVVSLMGFFKTRQRRIALETGG